MVGKIEYSKTTRLELIQLRFLWLFNDKRDNLEKLFGLLSKSLINLIGTLRNLNW